MRKLVVVAISACVVFSAVTEAGAATPGLAYTEDTVFTVLDSSVRVETTAVMSNTTTERRSGNTIYYSYFDEFQHVIPHGATDVSIASRGRELSITLQELDSDFDLASARLPSQLRSGQSRTFELSYVLPAGTIRGDGIFFSNPAFHSFPVWSFSDAGTGSLRLRVPEQAELGQFGGSLRRVGTEDGYVIWEPRDFDVPEELFSFVTITIDEALMSERFEVAGEEIVLRVWPGDDVWATFARDTIENGLPTLETLIGLPVPDQGSLEVTESVTPYFYGYAGWYDPLETTIEVGNELDDAVMLHELTHAWFNNDLFVERWVNEGLAEEFTWQAQTELGWPTEQPPERPRLTDPGAVKLVEWNNGIGLTVGDDDLRDTEEFGYHASWYTIRELVRLIGLEAIQDVLASVDADIVSYVGDDPAETTGVRDDWRRLLDLASESVAPDDEAAIDALFIDHVIRESDVDLLDTRREARRTYQGFVAQEPQWRVPDSVRHAMTTWDFEQATDLMDDASGVLTRQREVAAEVDRRELIGSDAAQRAYEVGAAGFDEARTILDRQALALRNIDRLRTSFSEPLSTNQRWGIGDTDLARLVSHAETAFSVDRFEQIDAAQTDLDNALAFAEMIGAERILWLKIGTGASGLFGVVALWVVVRRRRSHSRADDDLTRSDVVLSV